MRTHELDMNAYADDHRILEWEEGLPTAADLTPLSQLLIPPELASAFRIPPEPPRTALDVQRASHNSLPPPKLPTIVDVDDPEEEAEEDGGDTAGIDETASSSRASKRTRLVWTPQLHKRFVEVVAHLGLKNAVPKTIMQLMNVEGLTRENVASHLQKYRLYVKRMHGISDDGDHRQDGSRGGHGWAHATPQTL